MSNRNYERALDLHAKRVASERRARSRAAANDEINLAKKKLIDAVTILECYDVKAACKLGTLIGKLELFQNKDIP